MIREAINIPDRKINLPALFLFSLIISEVKKVIFVLRFKKDVLGTLI